MFFLKETNLVRRPLVILALWISVSTSIWANVVILVEAAYQKSNFRGSTTSVGLSVSNKHESWAESVDSAPAMNVPVGENTYKQDGYFRHNDSGSIIHRILQFHHFEHSHHEHHEHDGHHMGHGSHSDIFHEFHPEFQDDDDEWLHRSDDEDAEWADRDFNDFGVNDEPTDYPTQYPTEYPTEVPAQMRAYQAEFIRAGSSNGGRNRWGGVISVLVIFNTVFLVAQYVNSWRQKTRETNADEPAPVEYEMITSFTTMPPLLESDEDDNH